MLNTVPIKITPELLSFCRSISADRPRYIRTKPAADAQPSSCFDNVAAKIGRAGGDIVHGWAIWHVPRAYFEAEHHGVWRNRRGEMVDISPQPGDPRKILFLPDPSAIYNPTSIRMNLIEADGDDPTANEFVELAQRRYKLLHVYRGGGARLVAISPADRLELARLERLLQQLLPLLGNAR
jgi:hypothetical protein